MKNCYTACRFLAPFLLLAVGPARSAPQPDVPASHWAARAVARVTDAKIMAALPDGKFHGDKPVTRYELAVALDRFIQYIEAGRKPLHATAQSTSKLGANACPALKRLVAAGFLPAATPLAKGQGTEPVTAQQLSDALAQVTIRLSDRSLTPNKS